MKIYYKILSILFLFLITIVSTHAQRSVKKPAKKGFNLSIQSGRFFIDKSKTDLSAYNYKNKNIRESIKTGLFIRKALNRRLNVTLNPQIGFNFHRTLDYKYLSPYFGFNRPDPKEYVLTYDYYDVNIKSFDFLSTIIVDFEIFKFIYFDILIGIKYDPSLTFELSNNTAYIISKDRDQDNNEIYYAKTSPENYSLSRESYSLNHGIQFTVGVKFEKIQIDVGMGGGSGINKSGFGVLSVYYKLDGLEI